MKSVTSPARLSSFFVPVITSGILLTLLITTGCGSSSSNSVVKPSGNTSVTVLLSSNSNAQLTEYDLQIQGVTLTNQAGNTVNLISATQPAEFIHLNGGAEPLVTVSVPQDTYTSANVTLNAAQFFCTQFVPSQNALDVNEYGGGIPTITVNLPSPLVVTGPNMGVLLNLQAPQSTGSFSCYPYQGTTPTPTFTVSPLTLSQRPANPFSGKITGIEASVDSIESSGAVNLSLTAGPFGNRTLSISTDTSTVFQGISGASALASGMFLNMDGILQVDGSLAATRIEVENPSAINIWTGPLLQVDSVAPVLTLYGRQEHGPLLSVPGGGSGLYMNHPYFDFSTSTFAISGQMTNLQSLPFVPSFNSTNMVAGQTVDITSPDFVLGGGVYTAADTITLIPQAINGTVLSSSTSGNFTAYTVLLAPYDPFPNFGQQTNQVSTLTNPSEVQVYVDNNTQQLNAKPIATGSTYRFYGLVFNDNGTLRMDCGQVVDGVAFAPASNASSQLQSGTANIVRRTQLPGEPQVVSQSR